MSPAVAAFLCSAAVTLLALFLSLVCSGHFPAALSGGPAHFGSRASGTARSPCGMGALGAGEGGFPVALCTGGCRAAELCQDNALGPVLPGKAAVVSCSPGVQ